MVRLSDDATAPYYGVFATPSTEVHTGREDQHYGFSFVRSASLASLTRLRISSL